MQDQTKLQIWIDVQSARQFRALAALNGVTQGAQLKRLLAIAAGPNDRFSIERADK